MTNLVLLGPRTINMKLLTICSQQFCQHQYATGCRMTPITTKLVTMIFCLVLAYANTYTCKLLSKTD